MTRPRRSKEKPEAPFESQVQQAFRSSDWSALSRLCGSVLRKDPRHLRANRLLGFSLHKQGHTDDALRAYDGALRLFPGDADLLANKGQVLLDSGQFAAALPIFKRVCELCPDISIGWSRYAQSCYQLRLNKEGLVAAEQAMKTAMTNVDRSSALLQRAIHRRELGEIQEAIDDCSAAIALEPNDLATHQNRLLFMLALANVSDEKIYQAALDFGQIAEMHLTQHWPDFAHLRNGPWRKLRIGFLSPDLRVHSVMYFMEGILAQLDRRQFEVFALYLHPSQDYVTERVKLHADHFVDLHNLKGSAQAQRIRALNIDILIDLAGHTGHTGLYAMAHKAAPIQATWIGYPGTTGLSAVDYLITDAATDPPGAERFYSEKLWRLPTRLCVYRPMSRNPIARYEPRYKVRPPPCTTVVDGGVTFGCCNNLGKINDEVLRTWARILDRTQGSRLLLEASNFDDPVFSTAFRDRCSAAGISCDRLELMPLRMENQYLTYHFIDIALDPFPLNGGTTSMDVLWMGVPLVALEGSNFRSRLTTGILHHLGRREWLAGSTDEYVEIACRLARDPHALARIRNSLRSEVEDSVLMNEPLFNKVLTDNLRKMWLMWCQSVDEDSATALLNAPPVQFQGAAPLGVGIAIGNRVPLERAHQMLLDLVDRCKSMVPSPPSPGQVGEVKGCWRELIDLSEKVLNAVPHDAVALSCLAEVELAHGKTEFAVAYLQYAQESMARQ